MSNIPSNRISLPRVTVMGRQLEDTEPDYMAYYTSYEVARDALITKDQEIERLREALERYGRHGHPNCHDLTLKEDGRFGPRNGCLCGLDTALSGRSSPETKCSGPSSSDTPESAVDFIVGVAKDARFSNEYLGNVVRSWLPTLQGSTQETKPEPPATSMDYGGVGQVGCEGDDGLLRIHRTNETCDVCSSQKASGQLCDCGEFCKASLELSFNPKCRRLAKGLPVNGKGDV